MPEALAARLNKTNVAQEAAAAISAVLAGDFEESRFRTRILMARAAEAGETGLARAAARLYEQLGRPGESPTNGYSMGLLGLADAVERSDGRATLFVFVSGNGLESGQRDLRVVAPESHRPLLVRKGHWTTPREYVLAAACYAHRCYKALFGRLRIHGQ